MSKLILDKVTYAIDELTRVRFALARELGGRTVMSHDAIYKHLCNSQDEIETARIEMAKRMVRQSIQSQGAAD